MRDDDVDDTVIRPRRGPGSGADHDGGSDIGPGHDAGPGQDALGDTVIRPRREQDDVPPALVPPVLRPPVDPSVGRPPTGDVADTVVRDRPRSTGVAGTAPPASPAPVVRRVASIRLRDRVIPLDRPVVVGRRPAGPRIAPRVAPELVVVASPSGQVSGTHVTIHSEGDAVVVEDMRSTNGTFVRVPGAAPLRMRAGASMVVLTGTVVDIGDGNTIEIMSPHQRIRPDGSVAGSYGVGPAVPPMPGLPGADPRGTGSPGLGSPEAERHTS